MTDRARFHPSEEVRRALQNRSPVVALESTVITHGLPQPQNLQLARDMETAIRGEAAIPATVGIIDGQIRLGMTDQELVQLAGASAPLKISRRDFAAAILRKACGGTTVAGTLFIANQAGIQVFATGGIGGVHRDNPFDVSTDLTALAETPMIVVCAGAKAILDLPASLEVLESMGVPVVGFQTDEFPAFYSRESGLKVSVRLDSVAEIAVLAKAHWSLGFHSAILVANPIPEADGIPKRELAPLLETASQEAQSRQIHGQALTPFLLQRINALTEGKSLRANLALLLNNAHLAARIAREMTNQSKHREI